MKYLRHLSWLFLFLVGVSATCLFISHRMKLQAQIQTQTKRENAYQSVLHFYNQIFRRGMTRKQVEGYLNSHKIVFFQQFSNSLSYDLVKIGEAEPPWYCGTNWVYVKFNFRNVAPRGQSDADDRGKVLVNGVTAEVGTSLRVSDFPTNQTFTSQIGQRSRVVCEAGRSIRVL